MHKAEHAIFTVHLSDEGGGGFLGTDLDLSSCMYDGETREEAARNVEYAIARWIEKAVETGRAVPARTRPL